MSLDAVKGGTLDAWKEINEASYIIYKETGVIKAKNGATGAIDYSGTDAATVIQAAINALPEYDPVSTMGGGSIFFKYGVYMISSPIIVDRPLRMEGDVRYGTTTLKLSPGANCRILTVTKAENNFWTYFKDIMFEGDKANQGGGDYLLYFYGGYPILENLYVMRAYATGIYMSVSDVHCYNVYVEYSGSVGWNLVIGQNGQFVGCTSWDNGNIGMYFYNSGRVALFGCRIMENVNAGLSISTSNNINIVGNHINENNQEGIDIYNSHHVQIIGNEIRDNSQQTTNTYNGVYVRGTSNYVIVEGNAIYSVLDNVCKYGIEEADTADYNLYTGNTLSGAGTAPISTLVGAHSKVNNNIGYVTENAGNATVLSGTTSIVVNLSGQIVNVSGSPTTVIATPNTNTIYSGATHYVNTYNSGSFTINTSVAPTDNLVFSYDAKYKP